MVQGAGQVHVPADTQVEHAVSPVWWIGEAGAVVLVAPRMRGGRDDRNVVHFLAQPYIFREEEAFVAEEGQS